MRIVLGISLVIALAGCTAPPAFVVDASEEPTLIAAGSRPEVFTQAEVGGTLVNVDGCFGLENEFGRNVVIFPVGTTRSGSGLDLPTLGRVDLGDTLSGSGGYGSQGSPEALACAAVAGGEVAYLNPLD